MIFSAYVLSLGFVESGLGRRIAYKMLSLFGGSSLGIAFSLGVADLILAPAMPSVTARSGGIVLPVAKSINMVLDSQPGPKQGSHWRIPRDDVLPVHADYGRHVHDRYGSQSVVRPVGTKRPGSGNQLGRLVLGGCRAGNGVLLRDAVVVLHDLQSGIEEDPSGQANGTR